MIPIIIKLFKNEVFALSALAAGAGAWEVAATPHVTVPVIGTVAAALLAGRQIGPAVNGHDHD
jgi:hypothetical protein